MADGGSAAAGASAVDGQTEETIQTSSSTSSSSSSVCFLSILCLLSQNQSKNVLWGLRGEEFGTLPTRGDFRAVPGNMSAPRQIQAEQAENRL